MFATRGLILDRMDRMSFDEFDQYIKSIESDIWGIDLSLDEDAIQRELLSEDKKMEMREYCDAAQYIDMEPDQLANECIKLLRYINGKCKVDFLEIFLTDTFSLYDDSGKYASIMIAKLQEVYPMWSNLYIHPALIRYLEILCDRRYENIMHVIYDAVIFKSRRFRKVVTKLSYRDIQTYIRFITPETFDDLYRNPSIGARLLDLKNFPNTLDAWEYAPIGCGYDTYQFIWDDIYYKPR